MTSPNDLTTLIDQKSGWNSLNSKLLKSRCRRVDRHVVIHRNLFLKFLNCRFVLVGDSYDLQSLPLIFGVDLVKMRDALSTRRAPGGPKLYQKRLAGKFRLFPYIVQGERWKFPPLFGDHQLGMSRGSQQPDQETQT